MTLNVALAGAGAFGIKHLDGIKNIADVKVISLISRDLAKTQEIADRHGIAHVTTRLEDSLAIKEVDAVILCTPTQMHASQAIQCMRAGKHVQVENPLCDVYKDGLKVDAVQKETGMVAMAGHPRRFNPSHSRYMNVRFTVRAHGYGIDYAWQPTDPTERWWPGDTVQVTLPERKADA